MIVAAVGAPPVRLNFVGFEFRQNTAAALAATLQNITDYLLLLAAEPELNRIWRIGNNHPASMSEARCIAVLFHPAGSMAALPERFPAMAATGS
ncbi:MAG: hypothetical protein OEW35_07690 [Gammaproteobacteria bacterium]|nr:hypothetical protein [Gammaproteobacteria bacterium]MDH4255919.1 hypothetical protein [Gammaproteobacteria bacterium]MDH5311278.1 hypothetical protein [Gammaproteobacteria bacterium]